MRLYAMCVYIRKLLFPQLNTFFFSVLNFLCSFHSPTHIKCIVSEKKKDYTQNIDAGKKFMDCSRFSENTALSPTVLSLFVQIPHHAATTLKCGTHGNIWTVYVYSTFLRYTYTFSRTFG